MRISAYILGVLAITAIANDLIRSSVELTYGLRADAIENARGLDEKIQRIKALIAMSPTASAATKLSNAMTGQIDFLENLSVAEAAPVGSEKHKAAEVVSTGRFGLNGYALTDEGKLVFGERTQNNRYVVAQLSADDILGVATRANVLVSLGDTHVSEGASKIDGQHRGKKAGLDIFRWPPSYTACVGSDRLSGLQICHFSVLIPFTWLPLTLTLLKLLAFATLYAGMRLLNRRLEPKRDANTLGQDLDAHDLPYWQYNGSKFTMNNAATTRLGLVPHNVVDIQGFLAHVATEYHAGIIHSFKNGMQDGFVRLEIPFSIRGKIIWMALEGQGIMSLGQPVLAGTFHNISHIYERLVDVGATSRNLQDALNMHAGPFALWDAKERLVSWNGAFERDFGLSGRVQKGQTYERVSRRRATSVKSESIMETEPDALVIELFSGKFIKVIERRVPNQGMITLGVDITENIRNQQALSNQQTNLKNMVRKLEQSEGRASELTRKYAEAKKKAERAAKSKTDFLSNMSHELRTPLNAINGFSEMIHNEIFGAVGDPRYKEYAGDIHASGQHLLEMINDILDMAKIEAGKMTINTQLLDPLDPVKAAMRMVHGRAREKGLKLLMIGAKNLPDIKADHRAIRQMILNLTSNAIKFTGYGGEVRVRIDRGQSGILFAVEDTGVGIPKNEIGRLAKPFEQASSTTDADHEGTGLGLALTKAFTDLHNGRFYIESELGVGTVVAFELPIDPSIGLPGKGVGKKMAEVV